MVERIATWVRRRRALGRRFNPYIAGTPVFDPRLFFGREALVRRALDLLRSRSLRLTGERRIGKTSFLHRLRSGLSHDTSGGSRAFPVFVDLGAALGAGLYRTLLDETVETVSPPADVRAGLRAHRGGGAYGASDLGEDLIRLLEDLRERADCPVRLALLIDEADVLRTAPETAGDAWLGQLLERSPQELRVVLAGVGARGIGRDERGAACFEDLELAPLASGDAEALVEGPVAGLYRYEPEAVARILELSERRPYAIQKLCLHAVNRMLDGGRTTVRLADIAATADLGSGPAPGVDSLTASGPFSADEQLPT